MSSSLTQMVSFGAGNPELVEGEWPVVLNLEPAHFALTGWSHISLGHLERILSEVDYPPALGYEPDAAVAILDVGPEARGPSRGGSWLIKQGFWLWSSTYPTSGTSEDWAFTREFVNPRRGKLNAFVIEFNRNHDFFPTWAEMVDLIADIDAGLLALCSYARPGWWQRILCWLKSILDWVLVFWRRLFPWEIWGPFGPWAKLMDRVKRAVRT